MTAILSPITGIFTTIFDAIHNLVTSMGIFSVGAGYVMAVFLLTLLVRLLVLPLNIKQMKSQVKMQEIQPEIAKIQKKYKNNPEKLNQETMRLYKEYKINPMSGCLPLLIQMPILFALYYVFMTPSFKAGTAGVSFLWLTDLSGPDKLMILPILSAATTYLSSYIMQKSMSSNAENGGINMNTMNLVMAGMMGFMSINFPSMLVLYWVIGNIIQMLQTYILVVIPNKKKKNLTKAS
ncbi:membrane protein insertase YidC [Clostridium tarantellae]|uniref:Membrane protein insertase YidC n=1 Tax=Clostridium tarantellae TaxID=39493 RepID=A0A6I1MLU6_9CLOT|nr:membrane protein insertase YidC [Clostridium tarantellae]MPQ44405.1 membrane protein insertase YidC [Clostridium tarantellae]